MQIAGVAIGNGLDFYDFLIYSFFAAQIGRALFPGDATSSLLLSLATFGVGFVTRPLGGLLIGRYADRHGRRGAMLLSFSLMGAAGLGIAAIPPYSTIGMAAPVLAVLCRMMQGFALGGEVGPNTAYLLEAAPPHRRGLFIACQYVTQDSAILVSGIVGLGLSSLMSTAQLDAWGWRIGFLTGAIVIPAGLLIRRTLPETLQRQPDAQPPERRAMLRLMIAGMLMFGATATTTYTIEFLNSFAQEMLEMQVAIAFASTITLGLTMIVVDVIGGLLSDRFGPRRLLIGCWALLMLIAVPAWAYVVEVRSLGSLVTATLILSFVFGGVAVPSLILFTQALPARVRASGLGITYAMAIALFGGGAQLFEAGLTQASGSLLAPAWYMVAMMAIGSIGVWMLRPSQPRRSS